jgi:5,10-methylenetetrahydrofolate reductase
VGEEHNITMPKDFADELQRAPEEKQAEIAAAHMAEQVQKLLDGGVAGIHFYCMNRSGPAIELLRRVKR